MKRIIWLALVIVVVSLVAFAADKLSITGEWTVQDGESRVEIYQAANGTIEGKICWLLEPNFPPDDRDAGKPKFDRKNPDKSLRNRPIVGLVILKGFKSDGNNKWSGGTVYDPNVGETYSGTLKLDNENTLSMRGYIGISIIGRTEKWTRYKKP